jgi:hypothetical protein
MSRITSLAITYAEAALPANTTTRGTMSMGVPGLRVQDAVVARHHVQHVEQLALVFVDALDLHVEHRVGVERRSHVLLDPVGQPQLVLALGMAEGAHEGRLRRPSASAPPAASGRAASPADALVEQRRQRRVGLRQPAARRDAVGLVVEALRKDRSKSAKIDCFISSECSPDTPLIEWLASTAT